MPDQLDNENFFSEVYAIRTPFSIPESQVVLRTIQKLKELIPNSRVSFTPIKSKPSKIWFNVRILINDLTVCAESVERIMALPLNRPYDSPDYWLYTPERELGRAIHHFLLNIHPSIPCVVKVRLLLERENQYRFAFKILSTEDTIPQQ